ncbi:microsomal signal peptidase [Malassezia pachydermatis]|uniref:Signal peptidase complex subunit 1 n=1 Tax=Malassezia pachydermatis TaxID=77020 RepID=A0A0M8MIP6_9BASI|nr:microsomal signal peptidase [Malassezia pachydermatis]KOS13256.1 microsomal signal peptidase [Malassezia pachydermatis]
MWAALEGKIDYRGQALAERLLHRILIVTGILAFLVGYFMQDVSMTMYIYGAGVLLCLLVCLPPWPMYNAHHTIWLPTTPSSPQ